MITAFELACLTLEENLNNEEYKILTVDPLGSFDKALADEVCLNNDWEHIHACVGAIPYCGELGYLVKIVKEIPKLNDKLGAADAIYEVYITNGESLYYAVWAICRK